MLNTDNVAVAVDLSNTDEKVLRYAQYFAKELNITKLNLIHVMPSILSPGNADLEIHQILGAGFNLKERIKSKILENTQAVFQNGVTAEVQVREGNPYREFIATANELESALVVVGRKTKSEGSGITARRVAHDFHGNVLFIPEDATPKIQKIIVPIDFSDNSARALGAALEISQKVKGSSVRCLHVVKSIPDNYYLDLKIRTELDAQFRENAAEAWESFTKKNGWTKDIVPIDYLQDFQANTSRSMNDFFKKNLADLVIMGAKGHTAFENFLYGSVTERVVNSYDGCPLLIVR